VEVEEEVVAVGEEAVERVERQLVSADCQTKKDRLRVSKETDGMDAVATYVP